MIAATTVLSPTDHEDTLPKRSLRSLDLRVVFESKDLSPFLRHGSAKALIYALESFTVA